MTARRGRPAVDRFRAAAALLVVCIHTAPLASVSPPADWALKTLARVAVPFFFTATGFFVLGDALIPGQRSAAPPESVRRLCKKTALLYAAATLLYLPVTVYAGNFPRKDLPFSLLRDIVLDGTFYHLWYLPAVLIGVPLVWALARLPLAACAALSGALYFVGVLGDSWYALAARAPALRAFYDALFARMDYTRNGLFFAPAFLLTGALLAARPRPRRRVSACGLAVSLALLFAEASALRGFGTPRHDSMYLSLLPCAYFLLALLLEPKGEGSAFLRDCSMGIYLVHPLMIVLVRGVAKALRAVPLLVENSLVFFLAVSLSSAAASVCAALLLRRRGPGARVVRADMREARAWAEIDLDAIAHNAAALRACLPESCAMMAVVKADAYGHGAPAVAGRLWREGVRSFAVATLEEGRALRRSGIGGEILILGYTDAARAPELARWRLTQTVADAAHGEALARAAGRRALPVHIAVDTGLHRLGLDARDARAAARLLTLPGLEVRGMFTHLAVSDSLSPESEAFTRAQLAAFASLAGALRTAGVPVPPLHAQASYGILNLPGVRCALARPGLALYGACGEEGEATRLAPALRPALALRARVVCVRRVPAGESAGYGCAFTAARETLLAVVSIGYADGFPRAAGEGRASALLRGRRVPIVGRVCMDQLFVDATNAGAAVGDVVTLIGADGAERVTAEALSAACGTIPNELLCRLGPRVARVYGRA